MPLAETRAVSKAFGPVQALDRVSLELAPGQVLALLGPNGAGKTTLVKVLLGLLKPDRGEARIFGQDPTRPGARRGLGATPQESGFPPTLRVREVLALVRAHYPEPEDARELLQRFGLAPLARRLASGLSGGERRRLSLALAFAGRPALVVLDEPTAGLDVAARRALWREIKGFRDRGGGVLLTTHDLNEADALADRVAILHRGRLLAVDRPEAIRQRVGLKKIRFRAPRLPELPGVARVEREGGRFVLLAADADRVVTLLVRSGVPFSQLEVQPVGLEEAFLAITGEGS